jgi:hypothetical protein
MIIWPKQFIIKVSTNSFERKEYNSRLTNIKDHSIFKTPILHKIGVRLQKFTVMNIFNTAI